MTEKPFQPPVDMAILNQHDARDVTSAQATYNVVTDTVTGVNVRWSDNKFQAIFVFFSVLLTALLGALIAAINSDWKLPWWGGALIGSFVGLVVGILVSGIFLMIYRAYRHVQGKHD